MRFSLAAASRAAAGILAAGILISPAGAQEQGDPTFQADTDFSTPANAGYALTVSADKKNATVLVTDLQLDANRFAPFATRVVSISLPLAGAENGVKLRVTIEGHVTRYEEGAGISLITIVNGQTHVMDFAKFSPGSPPTSGDCPHPSSAQDRDVKRKVADKHSKAPKKPGILSKLRGNGQALLDDDFTQCNLVELPSASELRVNVILVLRRPPSDGSQVNVTTIHINVL